MRSGYRNKIDENALTKCDKCDCLILSDSSNSANDKCIKPKPPNFGASNKNYQISSGDDDSNETNQKTPLKPDRQSSIRIVVNAQIDSNEDYSTDKSSECDNIPSQGLKTDFSMKHICFRFCSKKKKDNSNKDAGTNATQPKVPMQEDANQTSTVAVPETKDETGLEPNINDIIRKYCNCKGAGGGCNTNTIIFPRDKICGDGFTNLENCIKMEARNNTRNAEEILNELYKQKREIREIRELLDMIVHTMRQQLPPGAFQNNKQYKDPFDDFYRKTNLERKSNTLSIAKSDNRTNPREVNEPAFKATVAASSEEKPKKKGLFAWCK